MSETNIYIDFKIHVDELTLGLCLHNMVNRFIHLNGVLPNRGQEKHLLQFIGQRANEGLSRFVGLRRFSKLYHGEEVLHQLVEYVRAIEPIIDKFMKKEPALIHFRRSLLKAIREENRNERSIRVQYKCLDSILLFIQNYHSSSYHDAPATTSRDSLSAELVGILESLHQRVSRLEAGWG